MNEATCKKDSVTVARIEKMHPKIRSEVVEIYDQICKALTGRAFCRFSYTLRTFAEQNELYAIGRTVKGNNPRPAVPMGDKVTNAQGGQSYHNYGLALDIVLIVDGKEASWDMVKDFDGDGIADWMEVVNIFTRYGWEWGGNWAGKLHDGPHFQKTLGKSVKDLQQLHATGRMDENKYVIL